MAISRIESTASDTHAITSKKLMSEQENALNKMMLDHEAMMAECDKKMEVMDEAMSEVEDGTDGMDADEEAIIAKILPQLPKPKEPELTKDDKAELEAKIEELKKRLANTRTAPFIGPSRGVFLKVNGVKQGIVSELNIVGSGVAITSVNGLPTITITGGGSGSTAVETPTGAVNGSNLAFTVANTPIYVIIDGVSKFETLHYTLAGLNITLLADNAPVQFIRSVYSA